MPIDFRCTNCHKLLRVGDDAAGRQVQCPECQHIGMAPAAAAAAEAGQNPFGPADQAFSPAEQNPFQSPMQAGGPPPDYGQASAYAAGRVGGPAIGLIVSASIGILTQFVGVAGQVFRLNAMQQLGNAPPPQVPIGPEFVMIVACASGVIGVLLSVVVIVGAVKMKNLENYGMAMTAAILAVIPCFSGCCLLELPFGIWALVVLCDPAVRAAFRR